MIPYFEDEIAIHQHNIEECRQEIRHHQSEIVSLHREIDDLLASLDKLYKIRDSFNALDSKQLDLFP